MDYLLSIIGYVVCALTIGIVTARLYGEKNFTLDTVLLRAAYGLAWLVCVLFVLRLFIPLGWIVNPVTAVLTLVCAGALIRVGGVRIRIAGAGIAGVAAFVVLSLYLYHADLLNGTRVSFGWNEDFFFHERYIRGVREFGLLFFNAFPEGFMKHFAGTYDTIHYPPGSHLLANVFHAFDRLLHTSEIAAQNIRILFAFSFVVFFLRFRTLFGNIQAFAVGLFVHTLPTMLSLVPNDFASMYPSFFLMPLILYHFLTRTFDRSFLVLTAALLVVYPFMMPALVPLYGALGLYSLVRRSFSWRPVMLLVILGVLAVTAAVYYFPMVRHIDADVVPGGISRPFGIAEILNIKLIYLGVDTFQPVRGIAIPAILAGVAIVSTYGICVLFRKVRRDGVPVLRDQRSVYLVITGLTAIGLFGTFGIMKPYEYFKLLPPALLLGAVALLAGMIYLPRMYRNLFIGMLIAGTILNLHHGRLYFYNESRTANGRIPDRKDFMAVRDLSHGMTALITGEPYFNNYVALSRNDRDIATWSYYGDILSDTAFGATTEENKYYLHNYSAERFESILVQKSLEPFSPTMSPHIFDRRERDGIVAFNRTEGSFIPLLRSHKPVVVAGANEMNGYLGDTSGRVVAVWQSAETIESVNMEAEAFRGAMQQHYPIILYSLYRIDGPAPNHQRITLKPTLYTDQVRPVLTAPIYRADYRFDVGQFADPMMLDDFVYERVWDDERGWNKRFRPGSLVTYPVVTTMPSAVSFFIKTHAKQEVEIRNESCGTSQRVVLDGMDYAEITVLVPEGCTADRLRFRFDGPDLTGNEALLDAFTVRYPASEAWIGY
jgi:hypothetical protein